MSAVKCGHCKGYHKSTRDVFFCSSRPGAPVAASVTHAPPVWPLTTPEMLVRGLREGRYAVRADSSQPYIFLRHVRPKTGKKKGCLVFQTQHSEVFKDRLTIYPSGKAFCPEPRKIDQALLLACVDPITSMRAYARELGVCGRCGRKLTDERSRWYGIGPECEESWPDLIDEVDEENGFSYYPGCNQ